MSVLSYLKTIWQDRAVQYPNRYDKSGETSSSVTLVPNAGTVTQAGTPINASKLNNLENGVAAALPAGTINSDMSLLAAMLIETDTRGVFITRDILNRISQIQEKDGTTIMRTTTVNRATTGLISTVVQVGGGKTITYTLNRNATNQKIDNVTKTVV